MLRGGGGLEGLRIAISPNGSWIRGKVPAKPAKKATAKNICAVRGGPVIKEGDQGSERDKTRREEKGVGGTGNKQNSS